MSRPAKNHVGVVAILAAILASILLLLSFVVAEPTGTVDQVPGSETPPSSTPSSSPPSGLNPFARPVQPSRGHAAAVAVGDWNLGPYALGQIASPGGKVVTGHKVDNALTYGRIITTDVLDLGAWRGSDHHAIAYRFKVGGASLRVLAWNVYVGNPPDRVRAELGRLLLERKPAVVVLNEAYRLGPLSVAGYDTFHRFPGERADTAVLVRDDVEVGRVRWVRMTEPWRGPIHGDLHAPRQYVSVRLLWGGHPVRLLGVHLPTGGPDGPNAAAVRESMTEIRGWLHARG